MTEMKPELEEMKSLVGLLPVELEDYRLKAININTEKPRRLHLFCLQRPRRKPRCRACEQVR